MIYTFQTTFVTKRQPFDQIPYRLYYSNVWLKPLKVQTYKDSPYKLNPKIVEEGITIFQEIPRFSTKGP